MPIISGPGPSLRSQWLGEKLRELRAAKKMSLRVAGEYLQRDASTMSRYENGEYPLRRADLIALMTLYDVSDPQQRADLEQICEDSWQRDWWDQHRDDFGKEFINMPWLESRATQICAFHVMLVDGLLQTRDYAETLIRSADRTTASSEQIDRWIELRLDRQRILDDQTGPQLSVILEESVLHRPVGGPQVWMNQLRRLVTDAERANIEVRVLPFEAVPHSGHKGSFTLFELPDPYPEVAYLDTAAGQLFVEEPTVGKLRTMWDNLDRKALDAEQSFQLIAQQMKELE